MYLLLVILFNLACVFWFFIATKEVNYLSKSCWRSNPYLRAAESSQGYAAFMCLLGIILIIGEL